MKFLFLLKILPLLLRVFGLKSSAELLRKPLNIPKFLVRCKVEQEIVQEKLICDLPSPSVQPFPEVSHKVTWVHTAQHQMFNSVWACQSTLKMQVALGACQPGTVTGWWHRCGTLGGAGNACSALPGWHCPDPSELCLSTGILSSWGCAWILWAALAALCFSCPSPSPAGFSPSPEALPVGM